MACATSFLPPKNISIQPKLSKPEAKPVNGHGIRYSSRKPTPATISGDARIHAFFSANVPRAISAVQPTRTASSKAMKVAQ